MGTGDGATMKPAPFDYVRASSPEHAVALLGEHRGDARLIAGGQSLVPMMNLRLARPAVLVDIARLPLADLAAAPGSIEIGATTRHCAVIASEPVAAVAPIVRRAMQHVAHPTIRNLGTAGGSVAYADPTAELPALMVLLDGEIITLSSRGRRTIPASQFFRSAFDTMLAEDEMIVGLHLKPPAGRHGGAFLEVAERQGDYAIAAAGVTLVVDGGVVSEARIVLSGVDSRPIRADAAEEAIIGKRVDPDIARMAAYTAVAGRSSYEDIRGSAEYRRALLETLTERAIGQAWKEVA